MEFSLSGIAQHGTAILFAAVFLESIGVPVPAAVALLILGAASARGSLFFPVVAAGAIGCMMLGDMILFLLGRYTGWWLLGLLCRLSLNPESCILRSADSFHRRGRVLLLFAKFIPGINTMAPPLAGSMNMRFVQFLGLDVVGASLYVGTYLSAGFLFSGAIDAIADGYHTAGRVFGWVVIAAVLAYVGVRVWAWVKSRRALSVPFATPAEAAKAVASAGAVVYDVRSHGYYDPKAMRVKGSQRLDPNALNQGPNDLPADRPIYLYCTCIREATSARVAQLLSDKGLRAIAIKGGLRAWKKAGLPLEQVPADEMAALPVFDN